MSSNKISPSDVRPDSNNPNWTKPRSYGVWKLPPATGSKRHRYGNYPVRGKELIHEYGEAKLIALFTSRYSAITHANDLNS